MAHSEASETAANVRAEMARAGYSSRKLAQELTAHGFKFTSRTLSRRLAGEGAFRIDELTAIAGFLDIPLAALLPGVAA